MHFSDVGCTPVIIGFSGVHPNDLWIPTGAVRMDVYPTNQRQCLICMAFMVLSEVSKITILMLMCAPCLLLVTLLLFCCDVLKKKKILVTYNVVTFSVIL